MEAHVLYYITVAILEGESIPPLGMAKLPFPPAGGGGGGEFRQAGSHYSIAYIIIIIMIEIYDRGRGSGHTGCARP